MINIYLISVTDFTSLETDFECRDWGLGRKRRISDLSLQIVSQWDGIGVTDGEEMKVWLRQTGNRPSFHHLLSSPLTTFGLNQSNASTRLISNPSTYRQLLEEVRIGGEPPSPQHRKLAG
ncbi:hypothetical protein CEXT_629451 [Caerostris extrusa]|uniref:Uncharacterized protein n=1 Tax=Caerostris extrusa TaxID=172846 RepID=A0AAV4TV77_CAEEX|nr:hypothetical protein CEXT_629451 [Caerostris extrusa]